MGCSHCAAASLWAGAAAAAAAARSRGGVPLPWRRGSWGGSAAARWSPVPLAAVALWAVGLGRVQRVALAAVRHCFDVVIISVLCVRVFRLLSHLAVVALSSLRLLPPLAATSPCILPLCSPPLPPMPLPLLRACSQTPATDVRLSLLPSRPVPSSPCLLPVVPSPAVRQPDAQCPA